jgi:cellulose 1,4-beta-cellobiosidase
MLATRSAVWTLLFSTALLTAACATGVEPDRPADDAALGASGGSNDVVAIPGAGGVGTTMPLGAGGASGGHAGVAQGGLGGVASGSGGVAPVGAGGGPPIPPAIGDLKVQYRTMDEPNDNELKPQFNIVNTGTKAIPLSDLTIRYFYTADGTPSGTDYQQLTVDYADIGRITNNGTSVKLSFAALTPPETLADTYLEIGFVGSNTLGGGQSTNQIETRVNWKNYTPNYDETNDYSWDATKTSFVDWPKVTLYQRGVLVWGREPNGRVPAVGGDAGTGSDASTPLPPRDAARD